jgi:hypothetical protein
MQPKRLQAFLVVLILAFPFSYRAAPDIKDKTRAEWNAYVGLTEKRIDTELKPSPVPLRSDLAFLKSGKVQIQPLTTPGAKGKDISDGAIHHWLGAVFIPNSSLDKLIPWLQNYAQYQDYFSDLEQSRMLSRNGDEFEIFLRMKRSKLGVTAHFNTKHKAAYTRRAPGFVSSVSRSTEIRQVKDVGTASESQYPEGQDSGYLWGLNSYWRFIERDGGVVVECETVGLSRSLGFGLGILNVLSLGKVKGIAESIAREALDDTLTGLRSGVTGGPRKSSR